jgi:MFS family permease
MSRSAPTGYSYLLAGSGTWFGFWGGHMVVFQWLLVEHLKAPPEAVGAAQMSITLPSLLFLLVGGATADRFDPRRLIVGIHLATGVLVAGLAVLLALFSLSYALILPYALAIGTLQAFAFPARDTLLSEVVRGRMSRAVAGTTLAQHAAQVAGSFLAGTASVVGAVPVLGGLGLLVCSGALPLGRLPRRVRPVPHDAMSLSQLRSGVVEVFGSSTLLPVLILATATGVLYVGPYLVILPLLVRDVYGGGAAEMAALNAMFPLGSVIGGLVIVWRGGLRRTGRALVLGQIAASFCVAAISMQLSFAGTVVAVLGWGLAGALFITAGRTLFQSHASEAHRARVLSVYSLGVMGGAPIGSLLAGLVATPLGLHGTLALDAVLALVVAVAVAGTTTLWRESERGA